MLLNLFILFIYYYAYIFSTKKVIYATRLYYLFIIHTFYNFFYKINKIKKIKFYEKDLYNINTNRMLIVFILKSYFIFNANFQKHFKNIRFTIYQPNHLFTTDKIKLIKIFYLYSNNIIT